MNKLLSLLTRIPIFRLLVPLYACLILLFGFLILNGNMQLLRPAGYVASVQSQILWGAIIFALLIGSLIVGAFFFVIFHYKEESQREYQPDWKVSKKWLFIAWGVPTLAIVLISVMIWDTAHLVDPYQPISSSKKPITIQVIALDWKWLFLYPNDRIATVNMMEIPVGVPVELQLTADAPMNSFWVPRLSGQVYAMTGMVTQLHLIANMPGAYPGNSNEISGAGFAGMNFTVKAVAQSSYSAWKASAIKSSARLSYATYAKLALPSSYNSLATYRLTDPSLFNEVVMKFMAPASNSSNGGSGQ